jgi:hypothetical protein
VTFVIDLSGQGAVLRERISDNDKSITGEDALL